MRNLTVKIDPRHGEALTQMGLSEKRSRVAELEILVEKAWERFSNNAPLPMPKGETIQAYTKPGSTTAYESEQRTVKRNKAVHNAMNLSTDFPNTPIEDIERDYMKECARLGVSYEPLTPGQRADIMSRMRKHWGG